jgi:aminocarboxymuconate-semialdehyde decarboxylase
VSSGVIDIHTHIVPASFPAYLGRHANARWPSMEPAHDCHHCNVMIAGKVFRTVSDHSWSIERRLEVMDACRVHQQVLSPMPELLSYWLEPEDAQVMARHVNDAIATMVRDGRGRFSGLGMVPLQDPDMAARELELLMKGGGFHGVEIGTNVNGVSIADKRFAPFFQAAEASGAAVFVHALHPAGTERLIGPPNMPALALFPCETSTTIVSLIMAGVIARHPKLRIAFSHGGGVFALVLPRFLHGWKAMPSMQETVKESPASQARRLYYDTLVYDRDTLAFLIERFGVTQLCVGTDHPFTIEERDPVGAIEALEVDAAKRDLLLSGNARRFLGAAS